MSAQNNILYDCIKKRLQAYPDNYLCEGGRKITFGQLLEHAEMLGSQLAELKYGIMCKSELNTAKAILACLSASKTAILLSEKYGLKHSDKIIEAAKITHLITDEGVCRIGVNAEEAEDLTEIAFIMFTSGTTGVPKGSMISYENILANLLDIDQYFKLTEKTNILISRPLYHCAVLTGEFLTAIYKGLNIYFSDDIFNPLQLYNTIIENKINVMCGTPTFFSHLCRFIRRQNQTLSISVIACSGECMTETVANKMRDCFSNALIYNVYGLTEASPRVSYLPPEWFDGFSTSVGVFLGSVEGKIVNNELLIKGKSIMRGYYNDSDQTAKELTDGWLHTGDYAEIRNGLLYIKGRKDNLIIRGGMNIYPQEIENAVKKDKRIIEAYAFWVRDKFGQKIHLVVEAFECTKKDVYDICLEQLPQYQMPDIIEITERIARNASGKVIRISK